MKGGFTNKLFQLFTKVHLTLASLSVCIDIDCTLESTKRPPNDEESKEVLYL